MPQTIESTDGISLCPAQQRAFVGICRGIQRGQVLILWSAAGQGRTTVLRAVQQRTDGHFITVRDLVNAMYKCEPLSLEEVLHRLVHEALETHQTVIVDDIHLVGSVTCCNHSYPRMGYLEAPLMSLAVYAAECGRHLIFGDDDGHVSGVRPRAFLWGIEDLEAEDYAHICRHYLGEAAGAVDFQRVHRFAPSLNAHQLRGASVWLRGSPDELTTDRFIEYLRSQHMDSNVDLGEVQSVSLRDLMGIDEIISSLEANIVLPLENDELAARLNLKPKRGVLIAGPPGTGKTTIGRALAHRLRSKFFLIDGTFISGTSGFYDRVHHVFTQAKRNAPSIIFIDDSDVIFESGEELGLYRYLLTMLDGLESQSVGRVCLIMTAMNVSSLPPALIRSGRIELWLETRLPDEAARTSILRAALAELPDELRQVDVDMLSAAGEGLTGADLKRVAEDGKLLLAYDLAAGTRRRSANEYFLSALDTVRANRQRYLQAEAGARQRHPQRPQYYDVSFADQ